MEIKGLQILVSHNSFLLSTSTHSLFSLCHCSLISDISLFPMPPVHMLLVSIMHILCRPVRFHLVLCFMFPVQFTEDVRPGCTHCDQTRLTAYYYFSGTFSFAPTLVLS